MSEWKKVLLNLYLIFKFVIFILWIIVGTALYLFLLMFVSTNTGKEFLSEALGLYILLTLIYIAVNILFVISIKSVKKLIESKKLSVINYIALTVTICLEILFASGGLTKL